MVFKGSKGGRGLLLLPGKRTIIFNHCIMMLRKDFPRTNEPRSPDASHALSAHLLTSADLPSCRASLRCVGCDDWQLFSVSVFGLSEQCIIRMILPLHVEASCSPCDRDTAHHSHYPTLAHARKHTRTHTLIHTPTITLHSCNIFTHSPSHHLHRTAQAHFTTGSRDGTSLCTAVKKSGSRQQRITQRRRGRSCKRCTTRRGRRKQQQHPASSLRAVLRRRRLGYVPGVAPANQCGMLLPLL